MSPTLQVHKTITATVKPLSKSIEITAYINNQQQPCPSAHDWGCIYKHHQHIPLEIHPNTGVETHIWMCWAARTMKQILPVTTTMAMTLPKQPPNQNPPSTWKRSSDVATRMCVDPMRVCSDLLCAPPSITDIHQQQGWPECLARTPFQRHRQQLDVVGGEGGCLPVVVSHRIVCVCVCTCVLHTVHHTCCVFPCVCMYS